MAGVNLVFKAVEHLAVTPWDIDPAHARHTLHGAKIGLHHNARSDLYINAGFFNTVKKPKIRLCGEKELRDRAARPDFA